MSTRNNSPRPFRDTEQGRCRGLCRGLCLIAGLGLVGLLTGPAPAGGVTVTEGETARLQITVRPKFFGSRPGGILPRIRLWYDMHGGTAEAGEDYAAAHAGTLHVQGHIGHPMSIAIDTFADNIVEGDETFTLRLRTLEVQVARRWGTTYWQKVPLSQYAFQGATTATITDATPPLPARPPGPNQD